MGSEDPSVHYQMASENPWTVGDHPAEDQRPETTNHYDPASGNPEMKTNIMNPINNNNIPPNQEWAPIYNNSHGSFCGLIQDIIGSNYTNNDHNGRNYVDSIDQGGVTRIHQGSISQLVNNKAELMVIDALDPDYQYDEASMNNAAWMTTNISADHNIISPFSDNHGVYPRQPLTIHRAG